MVRSEAAGPDKRHVWSGGSQCTELEITELEAGTPDTCPSHLLNEWVKTNPGQISQYCP